MENCAISRQPSQSVSRDYLTRVIAYSLAAAAIGFGTYSGQLNGQQIYTVLYCLAYPHIVSLLLIIIHRFFPKQVQCSGLLLDSANTGALIAYSGLPLLESLMFIMILVTGGIIRFGARSIPLAGLSVIGSGAIIHFTLATELPLITGNSLALFSIICVTIFLSYQGVLLRQRLKAFEKLQDEARRQEQHYSRLAASLSKYLSPQVWESIFSGKKSVQLESQRKKLTVFFSDIKGFTELSEELEAEALTDLLNQYLTEMSRIALAHGGTIDKFVGDSIMVFFGDPKTRGPKKDALAAVSMALDMRNHMKVLRRQWQDQGIEKPLEIRMGINTGYCTVGNFGAENRMDYTLIGKEVNLASRLESLAQNSQILISHETWSLIRDVILCQPMGEASVKGFTRCIPTYRVLDFRRNLGATQQFIEHESKGFSLYLDTSDIKDYDRKLIIRALDSAAEKLRKEESGETALQKLSNREESL
ncbi:MAG: adenylate/guanylate cyclase domain-containing protein [Endozoicomonas sp.]